MSLAILSDEDLENTGRNPKLRDELDREQAWRVIHECEQRVGGFDPVTRKQKDLLENCI